MEQCRAGLVEGNVVMLVADRGVVVEGGAFEVDDRRRR